MCTEIEAKLKVDSLQEVERRLTEIGAEYLTEQLQKDCYFDDRQKNLTRTDRCLRLRRESSAVSKKSLLTYKGPREADCFKRRKEIETSVEDENSTEKLLIELGYEKILSFEKKRRLWKLEKSSIALDRLPLLGTFVEIEGPTTEKIADVQLRLGLEHLPHIKHSYALLMVQKLNQLGREEREVFFDGSNNL
jgi:adenylate cyclase class 2